MQMNSKVNFLYNTKTGSQPRNRQLEGKHLVHLIDPEKGSILLSYFLSLNLDFTQKCKINHDSNGTKKKKLGHPHFHHHTKIHASRDHWIQHVSFPIGRTSEAIASSATALRSTPWPLAHHHMHVYLISQDSLNLFRSTWNAWVFRYLRSIDTRDS